MSDEQHETCDACGRTYWPIIWNAENDLWNEVMGGYLGKACPDCFAKACEAKDIYPFFVAHREHVNIASQAALEQENVGLREALEAIADHYVSCSAARMARAALTTTQDQETHEPGETYVVDEPGLVQPLTPDQETPEDRCPTCGGEAGFESCTGSPDIRCGNRIHEPNAVRPWYLTTPDQETP